MTVLVLARSEGTMLASAVTRPGAANVATSAMMPYGSQQNTIVVTMRRTRCSRLGPVEVFKPLTFRTKWEKNIVDTTKLKFCAWSTMIMVIQMQCNFQASPLNTQFMHMLQKWFKHLSCIGSKMPDTSFLAQWGTTPHCLSIIFNLIITVYHSNAAIGKLSGVS